MPDDEGRPLGPGADGGAEAAAGVDEEDATGKTAAVPGGSDGLWEPIGAVEEGEGEPGASELEEVSYFRLHTEAPVEDKEAAEFFAATVGVRQLHPPRTVGEIAAVTFDLGSCATANSEAPSPEAADDPATTVAAASPRPVPTPPAAPFAADAVAQTKTDAGLPAPAQDTSTPYVRSHYGGCK